MPWESLLGLPPGTFLSKTRKKKSKKAVQCPTFWLTSLDKRDIPDKSDDYDLPEDYDYPLFVFKLEEIDDIKTFLKALVQRPDALQIDSIELLKSLPSFLHWNGMNKIVSGGWIHVPRALAKSAKFRCLALANMILWVTEAAPSSSPQEALRKESDLAVSFTSGGEDTVQYNVNVDNALYDVIYGLYIKALVSKDWQWLDENPTLAILTALDADLLEGLPKLRRDIRKMNNVPINLWQEVWLRTISLWLSKRNEGNNLSLSSCRDDILKGSFPGLVPR